MRNMSFFITTPQFEDGSKDITRRCGWWDLKAGEKVQAVEKAQGIKKGDKMRKLGVIEIVSVRAERLDRIEQDDVRREGFPNMTPAEFVAMFCKAMNCKPTELVNRIEFKRVQG